MKVTVRLSPHTAKVLTRLSERLGGRWRPATLAALAVEAGVSGLTALFSTGPKLPPSEAFIFADGIGETGSNGHGADHPPDPTIPATSVGYPASVPPDPEVSPDAPDQPIAAMPAAPTGPIVEPLEEVLIPPPAVKLKDVAAPPPAPTGSPAECSHGVRWDAREPCASCAFGKTA